jgi:hypothetical protein
MRNGAVNKTAPLFRTRTNESIVSVRLNESYLKSIDLNELIETVENEIKVTPPYFWRELVISYNRVHFVTNNKIAENLKRVELSNEYITEQGKQDKRVKETSKRLPRLICGCANPARHEKVCGWHKWN